MDHSIEGYLNRRTTAELEIIVNAEDQEISEEIRAMAAEILQKRQKNKQVTGKIVFTRIKAES